MSKLRALWRNGRGLLFVVLVGIAFYEMLEHFSSVRAVISRTTSVLMPILCGLMVAYIINIPATILQGTLFKKAHAAGKKYVVPLTVVLSYLIVFGILTAVLVIVIPKAVDSVKILFDNFETYYNSAAKWATEFWEGLNLSDEVNYMLESRRLLQYNPFAKVFCRLINRTKFYRSAILRLNSLLRIFFLQVLVMDRQIP